MARRRRVQHLRARAQDAAGARPHLRGARAPRLPRRGHYAARPRRRGARRARPGGARRARRSRSRSCSPTPIRATSRRRPQIIRRWRPASMCRCRARSIPEWREYERTRRPSPTPISVRRSRAIWQALEELSTARFPNARALMMKSDGGAASAAMLSRHADPDRDVRPGRRRDRRPIPGRPQAHREPHHVRHRRHQLRHGGAAGPPAVPIRGVGRPPSAPHPHGRHRHHRGRRRQHRVGRARRRAQGRPAKRRRRSGARLLRPRRQSSRR